MIVILQRLKKHNDIGNLQLSTTIVYHQLHYTKQW